MESNLQGLFRQCHQALCPINRRINRNGSLVTRGVISGRTASMSSKIVLITGGLTGIGRAAAVAFAKKGAKVVVAGRRDEVGTALVEELRQLGSEAEFINADVRKEDDVRNMVDKTVARFGRLD